MDADEINDGIEFACFLAKHGISPVLMGKTLKGIRPVNSQAKSPVANGDKKHYAKGVKPVCNGKADKDYDGSNTPIGIVN